MFRIALAQVPADTVRDIHSEKWYSRLVSRDGQMNLLHVECNTRFTSTSTVLTTQLSLTSTLKLLWALRRWRRTQPKISQLPIPHLAGLYRIQQVGSQRQLASAATLTGQWVELDTYSGSFAKVLLMTYAVHIGFRDIIHWNWHKFNDSTESPTQERSSLVSTEAIF